MKNPISLYLIACWIAHCLSASVPTSDWRLTGQRDLDPYYACQPEPLYDNDCPYPFYEISVPNDGVTIQISDPLSIVIITPAVYSKPESEQDLDKYPSNCTFTLANGNQFATSGTWDMVPQPVTAVSCPPLDTSPEEESTSTTPISFTDLFTSSAIGAAATMPPYPTAQEESFTTTSSSSSSAISPSVPTTKWRLNGEFPEGDPCHPPPGSDDLCEGPAYYITVANAGVPTPISNPMPVNTIIPDNEEYTFDEDYNVITNICTFTFADGSQVTTNKTLDIELQVVEAVSCPPVDGSFTSSLEEEVGMTTTSSISAATMPPYPTAQEESYTTTTPSASSSSSSSSSSSVIIAAATTPPYPTTPSNNSSTAVLSPTIGASNTAAGTDRDIVPFTGDAPSMRTLCVVPMFALLIGFWVLG